MEESIPLFILVKSRAIARLSEGGSLRLNSGAFPISLNAGRLRASGREIQLLFARTSEVQILYLPTSVLPDPLSMSRIQPRVRRDTRLRERLFRRFGNVRRGSEECPLETASADHFW